MVKVSGLWEGDDMKSPELTNVGWLGPRDEMDRASHRFGKCSASARPIGHGLFDADGFIALRALAEAVTGAIHLVPRPKRTYIGQFWTFHVVTFP